MNFSFYYQIQVFMKKTYFILTVIGTILPNIFVVQESIRSGNVLLYRYPIDTFNAMFANLISSAFMVDLFFIVILFLFWSYKESKKYGMKQISWVWLYTFLFGIAGGLPLFLYLREGYLPKEN